MGIIIYNFDLNISPKMSYSVLVCDSYVIELHAYNFVIKSGGVICAAPCTSYWLCFSGEH